MQKDQLEELVTYINSEIETKLGTKLTSTYLVGSYVLGNISRTRPDINWLLIWNAHLSGDDVWTLGEILTSAIDKFENEFTVRPEFRPFKFSYPIKKTKHDVFVNISNAFTAGGEQEFKQLNSFIPEYVFAGFKASRKLVFGIDVLENYNFGVSQATVKASAHQKIMSHKVQLDRIPLTYHINQETDLIFNESLSHGKNLMFFAIEMVMSDEELKEMAFLEFFGHKDRLRNFFKNRMLELSDEVEVILASKNNYPSWKYNKQRAREVYTASYNIASTLLSRL